MGKFTTRYYLNGKPYAKNKIKNYMVLQEENYLKQMFNPYCTSASTSFKLKGGGILKVVVSGKTNYRA